MNNRYAAAYALIGCGPRGMNVLERFVFHVSRDLQQRPIVLHIIDPEAAGGGIHGAQSDHLLLNTIASQLTTFVDDVMVEDGGVRGPSLYEWSLRRGVRVTSNTGEVRRVEPIDHLPRRLLGEYLRWAFGQLLDVAPPWLDIRLHNSAAFEVRRLIDGREEVALDNGTSVKVDGVVLCVGHTGTPVPRLLGQEVPGTAVIGNPYPMPGALAHIGAGETIGVLGSGLTAMDVIAELTVGRGGRYEAAGQLRYVASGDEPKIVLITRRGLPARARPRPYRSEPMAPQHLTLSALQEARARTADGRLDFHRDVLPLVNAEMRHRISVMEPDPVVAARLTAQVTATWTAEVPASALYSADSYGVWFVDQVEQDLTEARRGLDRSPIKAAFETLRDLREVLRHAVDGVGMTELSLAEFFGPFASEINRNVICPQLERNEELVALVRAGVLSPGLGPKCGLTWSDGRWLLESTALTKPRTTELNRVVYGFSPSPTITYSTNPVVQHLYTSDRLRPVIAGRTELGAQVDENGFAIDAQGNPQPTLAVFGPLAEGSSYYNHYVTSPGSKSRATNDADRAVRSFLSTSNSTSSSHLNKLTLI
ncbi:MULTISPECIES: FAD/NAD(P)-binding protein [Prauserella salsuginis group]|uniref:FAD/NAD(P)-binding protein n=1 Tax=Prauserella salsuginis TaxID=387889 RepID=A0ABW6G057_9PSEU|nr:MULTISPECIES: FAD/NAD(P)-binding protein [Prauserella salsuginis group]MCR3721206.1 FAD-NAD(P)-binding [Prauserella flava]MCR3734713.1 FAD-NAD(P)-binding [Prauserella salsuginis]